MTLKQGAGRTYGGFTPARAARCWYSGISWEPGCGYALIAGKNSIAYLLTRGSSGDGHGDTKDSVRTELPLVGGTIKLDEEIVDLSLLGDGEAGLDQLRADDIVDVGDGLRDTCAETKLTQNDKVLFVKDIPFPTYSALTPSRSSTAS